MPVLPRWSRLNRCNNIDDLREAARKRLPRFIFDYLEGGADDEFTLNRNRSVFAESYLLQRILVDISGLDTSTTVLGEKVALPIILTSTGANRLYHPDGELAVARAAAKANIIQILAATAMVSFDDVAAVTDGHKWCQMYVLEDRGFTRELTTHCRELGYRAMVLTADCTVAGNRERDYRNRFTLPPKPTLKVLRQLSVRLAGCGITCARLPITFPTLPGRWAAMMTLRLLCSGSATRWIPLLPGKMPPYWRKNGMGRS